MAPSLTPQTRGAARIGRILIILAVVLGLLAVVLGNGLRVDRTTLGPGAPGDDVTVLFGEPDSLDPAAQGDAASASIVAQLFEGLTTFDPGLNVRPALAESWDFLDGGSRFVFHLRPDLKFSDGTPLTGEDVVRSWLRVIDPADPSPLSGLFSDVVGATEYLGGRNRDASSVGISADGDDVEVRMVRPAAELPSILASPTFAVVPAVIDTDPDALEASGFVGSGAYRLVAGFSDELTLEANEHYWAGRPTIGTVHFLTGIQGQSPVAAFESGDVDYTAISDFDASWITYDRVLGPSLRSVSSLSVTYYGFDTRAPPFDDARVRQAFALAVDWDRLVQLSGPATQLPATSMVPPGIPGRSETDFSPRYDPDAARQLIADAGFPGGRGFPETRLMTGGGFIDEGIRTQVRDVLGIELAYETMDFSDYFKRLEVDPPPMWQLTWSADYPGRNDFLGLLLGAGQSNNYGRWASPEFEAAIAEAGAALDETAQRAAYDRAERIVQDQVPVIPAAYGTGWALARDGLLGAEQNGLGILRLAGLAWAS